MSYIYPFGIQSIETLVAIPSIKSKGASASTEWCATPHLESSKSCWCLRIAERRDCAWTIVLLSRTKLTSATRYEDSDPEAAASDVEEEEDDEEAGSEAEDNDPVEGK